MRLIASRYFLAGSGRLGPIERRLDPVLPPGRATRSARWERSRSDTTVMHRKDDFSDHVALGEALMRLVGPGEGIAFRNWNLELRGLHCRVQALEFSNAGDAVVADQFHAAPLFWRGLDAVRVRYPAAGPKRVQAF